MQALAIILTSVVAAVVYGILHDQITARICVEYFTIAHAPIFLTEDPTLLGIGWGIVATWWLGLTLGVALAGAARFGDRPPRTAGSIIRPLCGLMLATAAAALLSGLAAWLLARLGWIYVAGPLARAIPADKHVPFLVDSWAHAASYLFAIVGGSVVITDVWRSRGIEPLPLPHRQRGLILK